MLQCLPFINQVDNMSISKNKTLKTDVLAHFNEKNALGKINAYLE